MLHVPGEQADERAAVGFVGLERRKQIHDAWIQPGGVRGFGELGGEQVHVTAAHCGNTIVGLRLRVPGQREQLAHDLRIGLAIEAIAFDRPRRAHLVKQRAMDGASPCAVGPQEGAVDVEEDEPHDANIRCLVSGVRVLTPDT